MDMDQLGCGLSGSDDAFWVPNEKGWHELQEAKRGHTDDRL